MLPDVILGKVLIEHLHDLIRQCMGCTQDDIRLFGLHIFCVDGQKFLIGVRIHILTACQFHQTSHIGVRSGNDITSRKSHQDHHLRMVLAFVFLLIVIIKLGKFLHKLICLILPVEDLAQLLNGTVHTRYTSEV